MIDECEEMEQEDQLVEQTKKAPEPPFKHKCIIYSIPIVILVLVIIGVILIFVLPNSSKENDNKDLPKKAIIKLIYQIKQNDLNTRPISHEYNVQNNFELYLEGLKIKRFDNFQFTKIRKYNIEIVLYENNLNMDFMFKNITTLTSIQMITNNETIYIDSMKSTFENCISLTSISLSGFTTYNVKSMNKLFRGSGLTSIDLSIFNTSNAIDLSYMFANSNNLEKVKMNNFNTSIVEDMSYFFYSCKSLTSLDFNSIGGSNLKNISRVFADYTNLKNVEIVKFKTSSILDMSYM